MKHIMRSTAFKIVGWVCVFTIDLLGTPDLSDVV